jgi:hypothetical protein
MSEPAYTDFLHSISQISRTFSSVQVVYPTNPSRRAHLGQFVTNLFLRQGDDSPTPNPQARGPPLFDRPRLLIQYIRSYLHPQPEDAPAVITKDSPTMEFIYIYKKINI